MNTDSEVPLGSVATITMGLSPKGATYNSNGDGLPLLNGPTEFGSIYPHVTLFTTDSKRECQGGDLIFCVRGSTTGRMNWADQRYSLGRGVCAIRGRSSRETKFIKYCLDLKLKELLQRAGGGTFPNLTTDSITSFPIPFPEERQRIADILSAYDDLIENNTRRIAILEEMARALYREWFVEFRFPGHERVGMVESELGLVPEGWEVGRMSEIAQVERDGINPARFPNETFAHYSIPAFDEGQMPVQEKGDGIRSNKFVVRQGCVLLSKLNPRIPRVWLPFLGGVVTPIASTEFLVVMPKPPLDSTYLYVLLRSEKFRDEFAGRALGTSTSHQRVKPEDFFSMPIVVPAEEARETFSEVTEAMLSLANTLRMKNEVLRRTRDLLLPMLLSGNLNVAPLVWNEVKLGQR